MRIKGVATIKFILFFLLFFSLYRTICWIIKRNQELQKLSELRGRVSNSSIFIYRAYIDHRGNSSQIRVLALNECHNKSVLQVQIGEHWLALKPRPMFKSCPDLYTPNCHLVAYFHEVNVKKDFSNEMITVNRENTTEILPLIIAEPTDRNGITVCTAPMFWYTDWSKLIFFIEYWRKQDAVEIVFYIHSTTSDVKKVLDFYEQKEWITVIPWSMAPNSTSFEPNDEIYRLGQPVAHNDCFLRSTTEFTAVVDIDEIIYTRKPLIEYLRKNMERGIGSLDFIHHASVFVPPLMPKPFSFEKVNYQGLHNFRYYKDARRAPKVIARTDSVDSTSVHVVSSFRNNETRRIAEEAYLFHFRYTINSSSGIQKASIIQHPQSFQLELIRSTRTIFPHGASFNEKTQITLGKCLANWRKSPSKCMAPLTFCRQAVIDMEDWVEETKNVFYVL